MGSSEWRVMKRVKRIIQTCSGEWETSTGPCEIQNAVPSFDSGEYWCEIGAQRSNSVNITVSAGPVILEIPVLPVVEGDNVTLTCRNKLLSSNFTSQFFKDGLLMDSSSTGTMTIHSVSRSNEGLYKCSISEAGESPESWLKVRGPREGNKDSEDPTLPQQYLFLLQICMGVCVFLAISLLLVGFHRCRKCRTAGGEASTPPVRSVPSRCQPTEACADVSMEMTHSFNKGQEKEKKKKKVSEEDDSAAALEKTQCRQPTLSSRNPRRGEEKRSPVSPQDQFPVQITES
ncbi:low affinity immunoglobulin gamma Fc region receptor II-a-like [Xyrichtys novacula]|nr:low affinity immunoglobulin gamma Fc region receptor II-a-like [Xyrichtys novacula]